MPAADPGLPRPSPTESYWQHPLHDLAFHQSAQLPTKASVVIVGSGITGASVAYHLLRQSPDLEVVILESRTITSGATGRNGGHCKDVPFKTYKKWKAEFGQETAQRLVRFKGSHVDAMRQLARDLRAQGIAEAQFRDVESVTAVFDSTIFNEFKINMAAYLEDFPEERRRCGVLEGDQVRHKYGIIGASGALCSPAAALWPYRLITGLFHHLVQKHAGLSLEAQTAVTSIGASKVPRCPYLVHTSRGTIAAQHIIHCTNGHAAHLLPSLRDKIVPTRGQMTALAPPPTFPRLGATRSWSLYWPNGGFDYMSQAGDEEGVVYLGGGVEQGAMKGVVDLNRTDDNAQNKPALEHLCSVLPRYFDGGVGTRLEKAWTGIMGFTPDGFPVVGRVPRELGSVDVGDAAGGSEWVAAGFNGYGMVHCWMSGKAISQMLLAKESGSREDMDWFPAEQFACSKARLDKMDLTSLEASFHVNAPKTIQCRL